MRYTLFADKLWDLGEQVPGCYGNERPDRLSHDNKDRLKQEAWEKFEAMDMFFVKVSRQQKHPSNSLHRPLLTSAPFRTL